MTRANSLKPGALLDFGQKESSGHPLSLANLVSSRSLVSGGNLISIGSAVAAGNLVAISSERWTASKGSAR